jgi:hypothetical protein
VSVTSMPREDVKWVGLDVARDAIAMGVLDGLSEATPRLEKIAHDEVPIRRLVARLGGPGRSRACYEAGPTGYELHRLRWGRWGSIATVCPSSCAVPCTPSSTSTRYRRSAAVASHFVRNPPRHTCPRVPSPLRTQTANDQPFLVASLSPCTSQHGKARREPGTRQRRIESW